MKLLSPDFLEGAEKLVFDNLREWFPAGAVCVNVMLGQDPWDIRPLLLINNKVTLYRFSRPLQPKALANLFAEMQGFSVIPGWQMRVESREGSERLLMVRPFVNATLEDLLSTDEYRIGQKRQDLVTGVINLVKNLRKRNLVHGHISPANLAEIDGELVLLDPRLGALHHSRDEHLAPEVLSSEVLRPSADLFGLGSVLREILGDDPTHHQREMIDRLLLPSPRQRPTIEDVEVEFVRSLPAQSRNKIGVGKFVKKGGVAKGPAPTERAPEPPSVSPRATTKVVVITLAAVAGLGIVTKSRFPAVYHDVFGNIPLLVAQKDSELELAWASNDKARMRSVVEAAIVERNPAAENAIIADTLRGENRPGVSSNLLRVALSDLWIAQLSNTDKRAALTLSAASIFPEGIPYLPPLSQLHPAVILAIAGQSQAHNPSAQLKEIPIDRLCQLPEPVGGLFSQLKAGGTTSVGAPEAIALAGIVSGNPPLATLEAYCGSDAPVAVTLARISIILPLLSANQPMADNLLAILRDRGGELGGVLGWFDIDSLGMWSKVKSADKMRLILGDLPEKGLEVQHYSDLLTFPLADIRAKSASFLRKGSLKNETDQLLLVLSGEQNRLSREQTVAIIAALNLDVSKRAPYVPLVFDAKPSPDIVLLVLLARSNKDSTDLFNLEAARYLRKNQWTATTEMLQLLVHHPEPLARSLGYARLSTRDPAQKKILQQRLSEELDPNLLRSITTKLAPTPTPAPEVPVVVATPNPAQ